MVSRKTINCYHKFFTAVFVFLVSISFSLVVEGGTWVQNSQTQFSENTLSSVDVLTTPDEVKINGAYPNDTNTLLFYHFEDGSSMNVTDSSNYNHTAAFQNMDNSNWVNGKFGKALNFDGSNEYIEATFTENITDEITVEKITSLLSV